MERGRRLVGKWARLVLAGSLAGGITAGVFYLRDPARFYASYRCWKAAPSWSYCRERKPFEFETDFFGFRYRGNTRNLIDHHVLVFGAFEKPILYFLRDTLQNLAPKRGVFVDVGANVGHHSLFMSRYAREVHAFEPYEPVLARFRRMIEINHVSNVTIYPVALGKEKARLRFFEPSETNLGTGSLIEGFQGGIRPYKEVEVQIGDEALEKGGVRHVDLVKIDVEGYEKPVLQGLVRTLSAHRPVVVFELTTIVPGVEGFRNLEEIRQAFPKNYRFLVFEESARDRFSGFYRFRPIEERVRFDVPSQYDIVAYPAEVEARLPEAARSHSRVELVTAGGRQAGL